MRQLLAEIEAEDIAAQLKSTKARRKKKKKKGVPDPDPVRDRHPCLLLLLGCSHALAASDANVFLV